MSSGAVDSNFDECERLLAELLEQHHGSGVDPEEFFARHPAHGATLREWWQGLTAAGEIAPRRERDRFGPFRLLRELGAGAQGHVHLAEDTRDGCRVALKILPTHRAVRAGAVGRFEREAKVASRLEHPGICAVHESGEHEGAAYIAMQHLEGRTLAAILAESAEGEPIPVDRALLWAERLARALHVAHEAGLVHRDVKPGNVMITADDQPVLLDFGLAHDNEEHSDLTRTGDVIGTPSYMAPEQLRGVGGIDARADVYSLGVILFELLTSQRPFRAPTQEKLAAQILGAPMPDVRASRADLDRDTAIVVQTAMARDKHHRYDSAAAFAEDLRRLREHESVLARPLHAGQRLAAWCRRSPALAASLALLLLSLAGGAAVGFALYFEASAANARYGQLADLERLRDARAAVTAAEAAAPMSGDWIDRWLTEHAGPLVATLPAHRDALRTFLDRATAVTAGTELPAAVRTRIIELEARLDHTQQALDGARNYLNRELRTITVENLTAAIAALRETPPEPVVRFASAEDAFVYRELGQLVADLERFAATDGLAARMRDRSAWARVVRHHTVDSQEARWLAVREELASDARFAGRRLEPQLGLIPLGPDPRTQLQEFAFARGGTVPARDPDTRELQLAAESAPVFVLLPPGQYRAGSSTDPEHPAYDPRAREFETPPIDVTLDWFFLCKHELSRGQWRRLGGTIDSFLWTTDTLGEDAARHPVTEVTWHECDGLLRRHGLTFPTELQWEYAARAGCRTAYLTGNRPKALAGRANFRDNLAASGTSGDGYRYTAPIDSMPVNGFGLWHVSGNAAEWCREPFMSLAYTRGEPRAGDAELRTPPSAHRAVRGSNFSTAVVLGRLAARGLRAGSLRYFAVGLRPARAVRNAE